MSKAATHLQDIRAQYPSNLDRDELRATRTGLLTAVLEMSESRKSILGGKVKDLARVSQGNNLDIPVRIKGDVTINNVRSCNIDAPGSSTGKVRVVWKTVSTDIVMVPAEYETNEIGYDADLAQLIAERVEAFSVEMEEDLDLALETNKNQVYKSSIATGKYGAGTELTVLEADKEYFFGDIDPINFEDDFYDEDVYVVSSPALMSNVRKYINQGGGNNENKAYQFNGKNFTFSNRISNTEQATGYFMPAGSVGILTRVDTTARMRATAGDGTEWIEDTIPGMPFPVGVMFNSKCADKSILSKVDDGNMKATLVHHWQISYDYAIVTAYQDPAKAATVPTAIRKFVFDDGIV
jgi:hypothetical protein